MKVYGDIESVNLETGERYQRVTGNGESRLILLDKLPDHDLVSRQPTV